MPETEPYISNSCMDCIAASDDDRMNGYIDLKCNIGYRRGWDKVPFLEREERIGSFKNHEEVEAELPCKYFMSFDEYISMIEDK